MTPGGLDPQRGEPPPALGAAVLVALVLAAYLPVLADRGFALLNADDLRYIHDNPRVTAGLSWEGVRWALTSLEQSNWHPLTWISWQLDCQLFGVSSWAFHAVNLLWHAANAVLLFLLLRRATGASGRSLAVAALFAVHPLHVESVAWVSERKDVLSTFFCLLSMRAYVAYAGRPSALRYLGALAAFALGLTAKSMLVTLPGILLLLDVWPLGRLRIGAALPSVPLPRPAVTWLRAAAEKLPFLALALAGAALTVRAQTRMMGALAPLPLPVRAGNALYYYATYLGRMVWPVDLILYHPNPQASLGPAKILGGGLLLAAVSILAVRAFPRRPYLLMGWLWYLGTLLPVIGLVQVGFLATTDHYTYVPLVGIFIAVVWAAHDAWASTAAPRAVPLLAFATLLAVCVGVTRHDLPHWRTSATLWQRVVDVSPGDSLSQSFLAQSLEAEGRDAEAEPHYALAAELDPSWKRHVEDGLAMERAGDLWGARRELELALLSNPHEVTALEHLAVQFQRRGELPDAIRHYSTLARIQKTSPGPEYNLGLLYEAQGDPAKAREHLERALAIDPGHEGARRALEGLSAAPRRE